MFVFYSPDITRDIYSLNEQETKHCLKVLRLSKDDIIYLVDGKGGFYKAKIIDISKTKCSVKVINIIKEYCKSNYYLHIAIAPTKNIDRLEWFIEKSTEIGINEITPIICKRSERKKINIERLGKIMVSAIKQSGKAYLPVINPIIEFEQILSNNSFYKFIATCKADKLKNLKSLYTKGKNPLVLIGPEGDFTPEEIEIAKQNKFKEVSLGPGILRTETAGIAACQIISFINFS